MGRLIDTSDLHNKVMLNKSDWGIFATQIDNLIEGVVMQVSTAEAIPKAEYENRLKADLEAILTELQLSIEEEQEDCIKLSNCPQERFGIKAMAQRSQVVIQDKINSLKEDGK